VEHFFDWFRRQPHLERPWLILGKGPTFDLHARFDLSAFHLLSLNHAVRERRVRVAHLIDLDVADACGEALEHQAEYVVLPWYPHVRNAPGSRSLDQLVPGHALLRRLADQSRLLWYDLSTGPRRHGGGPVVQATYFSAEAAVSLLALAGARQVRSLGVDGGASYSTDFDDLAQRTLLANGQQAFDLQFQGIARTIHATGVDFAPLDQPSPILACVVEDGESALADRVLEFSLRKRASMTVRFQRIPTAGAVESAVESTVGIPGAPAAPAWRRALLFRPGTLVLNDIRKLWLRPGDGDRVERPRRRGGEPAGPPAVLVASAAESSRLAELAEAGWDGPEASETLPASWGGGGALEGGDQSVVWFADPALQPWVSRAHPLAHLWVAELLDAVREQFIPLDVIQAEARQGRIRPSLLEQVVRGNAEPLLLPWTARRLDASFIPPGTASPAARGAPADPRDVLRAVARHVRRQAGAYRRARRGR